MKNNRKQAEAGRDDTLPKELQDTLLELPPEYLLEVVMDLGLVPEARFHDRVVRLSERGGSAEDLANVIPITNQG